MANSMRRIGIQLDLKKGDYSALQDLRNDLLYARNLIKEMSSTEITGGFTDAEQIKSAVTAVSALEKALNKSYDVNLQTINVQKFNQLLAQSGVNLRTLQSGLSSVGYIGERSLLKLTTQLMQFSTVTKQSNKFLTDLSSSFFNTIRWGVMSRIMNTMVGTIQKSYGYIKDLDTALNDIRIVTGKSSDDMAEFAVQANEAAKALAVTTQEYTEGSLIYYQQGLDDKTAKTLTDITAKTSNVTGQSMESVSEQLTAVWNGYRVANEAAQEGMGVYEEYVDKMAAVGAATASDLEELSTAMSKVASAASAMGVDFDDLNAQIATIVSVTRQAPESVGTALKTIYARLGDLKVDGVDEFGTKLGEVSSQLQQMGVQILDSNGDMRQMSDVIAEVAKKWDTWTSAQKQAAAVAMAGKRQYNNLIALFDNWDMYGDTLKVSMEAAGTLEEQQMIAMDSMANKMDVLKATAEDLYDSLFNKDTIIGFIEAGTNILQFLADFSDSVGGLNNLLPLLGATLIRTFSTQIADSISTIVINTRNMAQAEEMAKSNAAALNAMFSNSSLFGTGVTAEQQTAIQEGLGNLKQVYSDLQPLQQYMSESQKQQYEDILKITERAGDFKLQVEETKERVSYLNSEFKILEDELIKDVNNADDFAEKISKISLAINNINDLTNGLGKDVTVDEMAEKLQTRLAESLEPEAIDRIVDKFKSFGEDVSIEQRLKNIISNLKELTQEGVKLSNVASQADNATESFKTLSASLKADLEIKAFVSNITTAIGAVGQLAMSVSTLSNIVNIVENDNLSAGQRILQIITNLSFGLPMLISSWDKLGQVIGKSNGLLTGLGALKQKHHALDIAQAAGITLNTEAIKSKTEAEVKDLLVTKLLEKYEINLNGTRVRSISDLKKKQKQHLLVAFSKDKEVVSTLELKKSEDLLNTSMLKFPGTWVVAALAAVGLAISICTKIYKQHIEQIKEANDKTIEEAKEKEKLIKTNEDLYNSYIDLYQKFSQGEEVQNDLYEAAIKLSDAYEIQGGKILALAGYYDELSNKALNARKSMLDEQIIASKNAAQSAGENAIFAAKEKSRGYTLGNNYTFKQDTSFSGNDTADWLISTLLGPIGGQPLRAVETIAQSKEKQRAIDMANALGLSEEDFNRETATFSKTIDYTDPKAVKEYMDQIDSMAAYYELGFIDKEELNTDQFYQGLKAEQKELLEYGKELDEQLENHYNSILNNIAASKELDRQKNVQIGEKVTPLFSEDTTVQQLQKIKEELKKTFSEQTDLNDEEVEKYVNSYLKGIDTISTAYSKLEIAEQIDKKTHEGLDKVLNQIDQFNANQLATISLELDTLNADNQLKDWIERHSKELELQGLVGINLSIENAINNYDEKKGGLQQEDINNVFAQNSADQIGMSQDQFNFADQGDQLQVLTETWIESTRKIVEEKQVLLDSINTEIEQNEAETQQFTANAKKQEEEFANLIKDHEFLIEKSEELREAVIQYSEKGLDGLDSKTRSLISVFKQQTHIEDDTIESLGNTFKKEKELESAHSALINSYNKINGVEENHAQNIENLQKVQTAHSKVLDDIQSVYSSLTSIVEDYNQTGHFTIDMVQQLMTMDDAYVATLNFENDSLSINEQGFQNATIAKLQSMKQTAFNIYYEELLRIAELNEAAAAAEAGAAAILAGNNFETMGDQALAASEKLLTLADSLRASMNLTSDQNLLADQAFKAFQNRLKAADDAISEVKKGGSSFKKTMGADKKSGGGSKSKKDKDDKKLEEEFDRYWELKKAIDATDRSLKKLDKDQENLYGKELINSLHKENELLEQQAANYRALAEAQKQEAAELQGVLSGYGVAFDASGAITNYAAATAAALQQYNDAIHQYNMGLIDESTLGVYEKNYEKFKKALERYDQLFYTEMKDTEEKLDEIRRKELANNLKAWEVEIQLKLDMKDLERQWNDFIHKVTKDFKKVYSDLRVDLKNMLKDATTYTGDEGTINTIIGGVHDVVNEIDKMRFGGTSDMFESISQAQEKLKELNSQLLDSGEALHDLVEQAYDNLLDGIDQVADQFDDLIDRFERINDELEFQKQIIELLYGEEAYGLMSKYYEGQEKNLAVQMQSLKQQVDFWQKEFDLSGATMENQKNWTKEQQKIYEELIEAQGDLNNLVLDYIQLLKDEYLNTVKDVLKQYEKFITGSNLDNIKTQWERISDNADKYYDSVEKAYEVQNLANQMDKDIAATTSLKTQQKLKELRDHEIQFLREKDNLTQHDVEYAEAKFQIALKEAALEDAQNNKTSMKLTRNEQGNWSYQYIADEEDTMSKRQELLDAYNQLYQLASDAYEKNLESMQSLQEKYLQTALEIRESDILSEDEKAQRLAELDEWYFQTYQALAEENALYRDELIEAGSALLLEVYEQDQDAYTYMNESERELLDALVEAHIDGFLDLEEKLQENYQNIGDKAKDVMTETREDWTSGAQQIADIWNGDNGDSVKNQVTHAHDVIEQATQHYKDMVDWCAEAVGRDFSEEGIAGAIMKAENETDNLRNKTAQLVNDSHSYLADLRRYIEEIEAAWRSVQQAIMDAIGLIQEYLRYVGAANAASVSGVGNSGGYTGDTGSTSGDKGGDGSNSGSNNPPSSGVQRMNLFGNGEYGVWTDPGNNQVITGPDTSRSAAEVKYPLSSTWGIHDANQSGSYYTSNTEFIQEMKKKMPLLATGGYTGEWNDTDGRIAMLHQKELVLNETDTSNFLKGINVLRDMTSTNGSIETGILKAVAGMALSLGNLKPSIVQGGTSTTNDTSNIFNITAEFPNANDVNEIREAILSLPNLASQYVNTNLR